MSVGNKMKKRILSMLITLVMILGLIPATALTVLGEENTVIVSLVLRPVDAEGNAIDATPQGLGTLDVFVNDSFWVDSQYDGDDDVHTLFVGENVLDDWDFCPLGYAKPDFDITLTADAEGTLTVTSGNATLVKEDDINYIVVVLAEYVCEHTFENGAYCSEGDYHYQQCDSCNYYDPDSAEEHYEGALVDHRCEACNGYVRAWCTPADAETDHFCSNGEGCGTRLGDLCVDADGDHVCDGCKWVMDWLCDDGDNDHLCDTESCKARLSDCGDDDGDGQCDICECPLAEVSAKFTELNYTYDADNENILVSGILIVYGNMEGTVTVKWRDGEDEITATGRVTEGFVELEFEGVDLFELPTVMVTFVPDNAEVATWEDNYNLWNDTLRLE